MDEIIKTFKFEAEKVELLLHIKKSIHSNSIIKMYIDGDIKSNNIDLVVSSVTNGASLNTSLMYKDNTILWISFNFQQGLRWKSYDKKTEVLYYQNLEEMKEKYIIQRDIIPIIGEYFFDSIKNVKNTMMLFETPLQEIIEEDNDL
jgi:hypothetical protein